ncbi:MAG: ABC transporter ATP-binding protein [Sphingomonadales bacterium]|nr:ABC transporter ATP-binding protein [Sphingomonadales bacterium]MBD3772888.1 ABC transporter ATP-binding protein [Paracoccaceae bacterium]
MKHALPQIVELAGRGRLASVSALSVLVALGEGLGFLLLVPLLAALEPGAGTTGSSPLAGWLATRGFAPPLSVLLAAFVLVVSIRALADYARALASLDVTVRIVDGLRQRAMHALVEAEWRALSRMRQSENRALLVSTLDMGAASAEIFFTFVKTALSLAATGLAALLISPIVAMAGMVGGLVVILAYAGLRRRARELGELITERHRRIYLRLEESLDALRLVKSYGNEDWARREVAAGFSGLRAVQRQYVADTGRARVLMQVGGAALLAVLAWLALERWNYSPAVLLPLVALFARAVPQLGALQECWQQWAHAAPALVATQRMIESVEGEAEAQSDALAIAPALTHSIVLDRVTLSHRDDAGVSDITLELQAGEVLALTGPSGAGKSTLADIIGGLLAPDSGTMAIDGKLLDPAARRAWRSRVAYVHQEPLLFTGTTRENLLWADPEADDRRLIEVLQAAQASFVLDLPGGLDCDLGEGGRRLSGGERQRIVLARALLRDPALLILDEATSALDPASDAAVADAVARLRGRCTMVIIGHHGQLATIADRRLQLAAGRLQA